MIKVRNLVRKYGDFLAVNNISFEVPRGQILGLLGHNGAGKTTTLKMLTGFIEPTSGTVDIADINVEENRLAVQAKIGYLPESTATYPEMTVLQYLHYVARLRGIPEAQQLSAIKDAIIATDLTPKADQLIATLSKGYKQRVGVAQAIIHKPEILILDEPTSGLDPTQIIAMRDLIKSLAKQATVILSTHIMQEVEAICDRVLIVLQGRIALDSTLEDLQKTSRVLSVALKQQLSDVQGTIGSINGVTKIDATSTDGDLTNYTVETSSDVKSIAPIIAKTVTEKGWDLYRLHHEHRNLETVFKDVNRGVAGGTNV